MSHNSSCTCAECAARPACVPQPDGPLTLRWNRSEDRVVSERIPTGATVVRLVDVDEVVLSGVLIKTPDGVEMSTVCGVSKIELNGAPGITALIVLCEDGRTRAVWYDREHGEMVAGVVALG